MNDANKVFIKTEKTFPGCVGVFFFVFCRVCIQGFITVTIYLQGLKGTKSSFS